MKKNVFRFLDIIFSPLTLKITIIVTILKKSSEKDSFRWILNIQEYPKLLKIFLPINVWKYNEIFIDIILKSWVFYYI